MNILEKIISEKRKENSARLKAISDDLLRKRYSDKRVPLNFRKALLKNNLSVIAEVKKASPSKGVIREDFNPLATALSYEKNGADCLSILTEEKFFQGHPDYLVEIRSKVNLPLLRKDFIIDPRQIRESYDLGADAILLIVACLSEQELLFFKELAETFGLTCLVEVHSKAELELALKCNFDLIGINNRDLATFKTDISHSINLKQDIPAGIVCVSESGINTADDCRLLEEHNFDAILVGETLMRHPDPGLAIHHLRRV